MIQRKIALVADPNQIRPADLSAVAGALQVQVSQHFAPAWGVDAIVSAFPSLPDASVGAWPIVITDRLDDPTAHGYHRDANGQPFATVRLEDGWGFFASHEMLEMLFDPFGQSLHPGPSNDPARPNAPAQYLMEVCDPVQDPSFGYKIDNEFLVSNFVLPRFYNPPSGPIGYDYRGVLGGPLEVANGGTITWQDLQLGRWFELRNFGQPQVVPGPPIGDRPPEMSAKEYTHERSGEVRGPRPLSADLRAELDDAARQNRAVRALAAQQLQRTIDGLGTRRKRADTPYRGT